MPRTAGAGAKRVIEHKDWSGGEFGRTEPWNAKFNQFTGLNMLVYRTGELGVRPGVRDVTPTTGDGVGVTGNVWLLSRAEIVAGREVNVMYGMNTRLYTFDASQGPAFATFVTGSITAPTALVDYIWTGRAVYFVTNNSGAYSVILNAVSGLTNSPNGNSIALYGDRLVIARTGNSNNIHYNGLTAGVSDFTQWTPGVNNSNLIPVGDVGNVYKLLTQRGHLAILKQYNGHYIITGQLGVNETLRQAVTNVVAPDAYHSSDRSQNGMIWFADIAGKSGHPIYFDGTRMQDIDHLNVVVTSQGLATFTLANCTVPFSSDDDNGVLLHNATPGAAAGFPSISTQRSLLYCDNVWTQHNFGVTFLSPQGTSLPYTYAQDPGSPSAAGVRSTDTFVLTDGGGSSTAPKFYGWSPRLDRPGSETLAAGCAERAGDASAAQVTGSWASAEVHLSDSDEMLVRTVIVDFRSWNTGGSLTNHFDLEVDCLRPYDAVSPVISLTGSWDEAGSFSSTGGTVKRQAFSFGDQGLGNGYQLKFTNIRGIAFQRVQVIVEAANFRGA